MGPISKFHAVIFLVYVVLVHEDLAKPSKLKEGFYHINTASELQNLPSQYHSTVSHTVYSSGILECSVHCLGLVECIIFGFDDHTCWTWTPSPTNTPNLTASFLNSGLYIKHVPDTPHDCADIQKSGISDDGLFWIFLHAGYWLRVYCDFSTDNGGWTLIHRRRYGSDNFERNWSSYKEGFGDLYRDFWLGNDNIHHLTTQAECELRVDLWNFKGDYAFAKYTSFRIGDENQKYKLTLGSYMSESSAGNSLMESNNRYFTTRDRDNDRYYGNCAQAKRQAWWFNACSFARLNGIWQPHVTSSHQASSWYHWKNNRMPVMSEMKVKRVK